jgi:uncharacterized membrane protein YkoI
MGRTFALTLCTAALLLATEAAPGAATFDAALQAQAKISETQARQTALAQVPGGTVQSAELEKENGRLIWSFDIAVPHSPNIREIAVDAKSGAIAAEQTETPAEQRKESAGEHR